MQSTAGVRGVVDAVVIGGGFYGCAIAIYLAKRRRLGSVILVERESALMRRASYSNQARVHNGYHYPRSYITAHRSRINSPRFVRDWPLAVKKDFTKLYAIARRNSKVTSRQFQRFCREIGAILLPADLSVRQMFEPKLIEDIFLAEEFVFDANELARCAAEELAECGLPVLFQTVASEIGTAGDGQLRLKLTSGDGSSESIACRNVFNCTYSELNQLGGSFPGTVTPLKQEITEMALMQVPPAISTIGVTVMDGPFFSMLPFPARGLHTLSHVRYTPHLHWQDMFGIDPYRRLAEYDRSTRVDRMIRDVSRYLPAMSEARYVESLFEVKTVLAKSETDDGRPILFEKHPALPGCYSVLGGKIDNIYDVLERLEEESFEPI
jgi:glycine/D-amino acid oxidase-like deaminating enzyme